MNVDSFACFDVVFLEKKRVMRLPSQKKRYLFCHFNLKNRPQELDFLEIRYYTNSLVIKHVFKIKQLHNALCVFVSGKLRFPGQVNIYHNLPDRQVVEKVNFDL